MRESGRMESFLFYFFLIEPPTFVIFLRVEVGWEEPPWPLPSSQKLFITNSHLLICDL